MEHERGEFVGRRQVNSASIYRELRGASRDTLLFKGVKLVGDGCEYLAIVRNVSADGFQLRLFHPLPDHSELAVELENGERHAVHIVWQTDVMAGGFFIDPVDVAAFRQAAGGGLRRQHLRVKTSLEGHLRTGMVRAPIMFKDISRGGAQIECDVWLGLSEGVTIGSPRFPALRARICWRDYPRYGVEFEQIFRFDELAVICAAEARRRH